MYLPGINRKYLDSRKQCLYYFFRMYDINDPDVRSIARFYLSYGSQLIYPSTHLGILRCTIQDSSSFTCIHTCSTTSVVLGTRSKRSFYCRLLSIDINYLILPLARNILLVASHIVCDCQARTTYTERDFYKVHPYIGTLLGTPDLPLFAGSIIFLPAIEQGNASSIKTLPPSDNFSQEFLTRHIIAEQNCHSTSYSQPCSC